MAMVMVSYESGRSKATIFRTDLEAAEYIDKMRINPKIVLITTPGRASVSTDAHIPAVVWYERPGYFDWITPRQKED